VQNVHQLLLLEQYPVLDWHLSNITLWHSLQTCCALGSILFTAVGFGQLLLLVSTLLTGLRVGATLAVLLYQISSSAAAFSLQLAACAVTAAAAAAAGHVSLRCVLQKLQGDCTWAALKG
jgi:hypothetical protein